MRRSPHAVRSAASEIACQDPCSHIADILQQAAKLYQEEGQFNPHAARALRKQAKKGQRRRISLVTQKAAEEEYDFAEAFDNVAVGSDED